MRQMAADSGRREPRGRITVRLNGDAREVTTGSVVDLLESLEIDPRAVVVELNRTVIRRPDLESTHIKEGDEIELVHFVGGG